MAGGLAGFVPDSFAAAPASSKPEPPSPYSIRWIPVPTDSNQVAVRVLGVDKTMLQALERTPWSTAQWQRLLTVHAEQGELFADIGLPPMSGTYQVDSGSIGFRPGFALTPGVTYRARFHPARLPGGSAAAPAITSEFRPTSRRAHPRTVVSRVHPSADLLPENLLKFYIHFSGPMSGGHIYKHIRLRNASGRAIELPFLEIDEELWNPDMTRLTLFIDPGRIKRGVQPLEEIGPALEEGKRFTLSIDRDWKDAEGVPLKESFTKTFLVGPPLRAPIDTALWNLAVPVAGSRTALTVTFAAPLDHALAQRLIRVARVPGGILEGVSALEDQERRWTFIPAQPWARGPHQLLAQTTLEDLAGNNIGKSFEVDLFESVQRRLSNTVVTIDFRIEPAGEAK